MTTRVHLDQSSPSETAATSRARLGSPDTGLRGCDHDHNHNHPQENMMKTTPSTSNPAPILELPDDLDALDALYKASRDRAEHLTCWLIAEKVRNSGPLPGAQLRLWKERRQLAYCSLTDEERRTCHARL